MGQTIVIDNKSQSGSFINVFSNRLEEKTCPGGPEGQKILLATYIYPELSTKD